MSLSLGLGLGLAPRGGGGVTITAPVLTLTGAAGTNPPQFTIDTVDASGAVVGDYFELGTYTNSGLTSNVSGSPEQQLYDMGHFLGSPFVWASQSALAASTQFWWRVRVKRGATYSAWSNTLTDTTASGTSFPLSTSMAGANGTTLVSQTGWAAVGDATEAGHYRMNGAGRLTNAGFAVTNPMTGFPSVQTSSTNNSISGTNAILDGGSGHLFAVLDVNNFMIACPYAGGLDVYKTVAGVNSYVTTVASAWTSANVLKVQKKTGGTVYDILKDGVLVGAGGLAIPAALQGGTLVGLGGIGGSGQSTGDTVVTNS